MGIYRETIPVQRMTFATGTWAYTAPTTTALGYQGKTATAETSTVTIPFGLNADADNYGAKLLRLEVPTLVGTANLSGAITTTLHKFNTWRAQPVPSQTFTVDTLSEELILATRALPSGIAVQVSTSSALPGGLAAVTTYFVGAVNGLRCKLYTTRAAALAGDVSTTSGAVSITSAGSGTQTITVNAIDAEAITHTLAGDQVGFSSTIRSVELNVTTPAFENLIQRPLMDAHSYVAVLTIPAGASTVVRVHDAIAFYERV
jgi:hypothetical protein